MGEAALLDSMAEAAASQAVAAAAAEPAGPADDGLSREQVLALYQNCIKLASENKINQKNTWSLPLIDHISEIVLGDDNGDDAQTNFQKASCMLEAGVKIYSYRVDSMHSETYKVLSALNRSAAGPAPEEAGDGDGDGNGSGEDDDESGAKRKVSKKLACPSATLDLPEALNVKKYDLAFSVDPLFHQTQAQFDEGGARGLLLHTLSVHRGCELVFDSLEVPDQTPAAPPADLAGGGGGDDVVDLSFAWREVQAVLAAADAETEISPALDKIVALLDDPRRAAAVAAGCSTAEADVDGALHAQRQLGSAATEPDVGSDFGTAMTAVEPSAAAGDWDSPDWDHEPGDGGGTTVAASDGGVDADMEGVREDGASDSEIGEEDESGQLATQRRAIEWLAASLGLTAPSKSGRDPWPHHRPRDQATRKARRERKQPAYIDFYDLSAVDVAAFAPPEDPRETLLARSTATAVANTLLPPGGHYQPLKLVRLYFRPNVLCVRRRSRQRGARRAWGQEGPLSHADYDGDRDGIEMDDGHAGSNSPFDGPTMWDLGDEEHSEVDDFLPQPRKVEKVDIHYARASKQVDVKALKETLWTKLQKMTPDPIADEGDGEVVNEGEIVQQGEGLSFRSLLQQLPEDCSAAPLEDISVHLCFICMLHLANENNLHISSSSDMSDLCIRPGAMLIPDSIL
eukprot:SM000168S02574  [mRNA]  locus=s168:81286:85109:+ [translate_table: standard]